VELTLDPTFRIASEADADTVLAMMREYYAYDGHTYDEPRARVALLDFLRDPAFGRAWLICDRDTPMGYIVLTFGYSLEYLGRDAFIDELFLTQPYRGRGWGRATLAFIEEAARASGVRALHLEVVRANTTAKEVYRRNGYSDHGHHLMSKWIERGFSKPGSTPD
jgi:diamine N-acetyltransferase